MSWLSQGIADVGNFWNSQPNWAKGLEIGVGGLALGGVGAGLAGIGPLAGVFGGEAGLGGAAATTGGIDAITTGAATGAGGAIDYTGGVGAMSLGLSPSALGGGGGLADAGLAGVTDPEALAQLQAAGYSQPTFAAAAGDTSGITPGANISSIANSGQALPDVSSGGIGGQPEWSVPSPANPMGTTGQMGIGAAGTGTGTPTSTWFGDLTKGMTPMNLAGTGISAGALGYAGYNQYQQTQALKQLEGSVNQQSQQNANVATATQAQAQPEFAIGSSLQQPLTTDTLPASAQASIDQQVQTAKAQAIAGYANRGMSADPSQNSALAADLANIDQQALSLKNSIEQNYFNAGIQANQVANQMIASGLSASQISAQLPIQLQTLDMQLAAQTSAAISSFARGLTPTAPQPVQIVGGGGSSGGGGASASF